MEAVRNRSESPFSNSKTKSHLTDAPENGSTITEQVKSKKKSLRNKCKSQFNENENVSNNGNDYFEEGRAAANEIDNNIDSNSTEYENGITNGDSTENGESKVLETNVTENEALSNIMEEKIVNEMNSEILEEPNSAEGPTMEIDEDSTGECIDVTETENNANKDSSTPENLPPESESTCESSVKSCNEGANEIFNGEANSSNQEQEIAVDCSEIKESQTSFNGSEVSFQQEESNATQDQASPDTATKEENSISNKITNFLGKWAYSQEQKQDPEVSSSKKIEATAINHPYLSKVSGRRGIKDRLNSSETVFSSREMEAKTPEQSGISLDDSFRVRTNPPRLSSSDLEENPTLRKFKGKRCLNVGDEPEEEDETYLSTMKRRKLNEKTEESGLLGSILWTPFKKKAFDNGEELKLRTNESKLSRLLSPFWFWKKTADGQNQK